MTSVKSDISAVTRKALDELGQLDKLEIEFSAAEASFKDVSGRLMLHFKEDGTKN